MTPKQKKVFDFITTYQERHGYAPSQQEIARGCGFESLGTVQHYLKLLERDGFLSRRWNGRRSIELNKPAQAVAAGMELPFVGIVAAGRPIEAFQQAEVVEVPSAMAGTGNVVYEVRGDSMIDQGIMDGDYVTVHSQPTAENGQTVIAELNGSITIKRFVRKGNSIELHPANPTMTPIMVQESDEFHIRGILVGSMRFYKKWKGK
ncbi:transcriptional repressor LexA [Pelotalea chapellei]|uniref:Transcriptional repressor LexA n=1 Tax=Pelotalea chapellei TaxID=44671 RepID=A0ABS5UB95_9BACT|nr:transcriptional repressor LexA [Pelotalea chapellei]MBT1072956.1 transcriptional repressor LexA [Pelotalea chapellei]